LNRQEEKQNEITVTHNEVAADKDYFWSKQTGTMSQIMAWCLSHCYSCVYIDVELHVVYITINVVFLWWMKGTNVTPIKQIRGLIYTFFLKIRDSYETHYKYKPWNCFNKKRSVSQPQGQCCNALYNNMFTLQFHWSNN